MDPETKLRLAGFEAKLDEVEGSLGRLEDGTYWACRDCGRPLEPSETGEPPTSADCPACGLAPGDQSAPAGS